MKKLYESKLFRIITFSVLFLCASILCYFSMLFFAPIVTNEFNDLPYYLCTVIALWLPTACICFLYVLWNTKNVASRWKIARNYGIIIGAVALVDLIYELVITATLFNWKIDNYISLLYPFDVIALLVIILITAVLALIYAIKNKDLKEVPITLPVTRTRTIVWQWVLLTFTSYFTGVALGYLALLGEADNNSWAGFYVMWIFLVMLIQAVVFGWYKFMGEEKKQKHHLIGMIIVAGAFVLIYGLFTMAIIINPYMLQESFSGLCLLGYAIKVPFAVMVSGLGVVIPLIVSLVTYIKRYKKN